MPLINLKKIVVFTKILTGISGDMVVITGNLAKTVNNFNTFRNAITENRKNEVIDSSEDENTEGVIKISNILKI